MTHTTTNAAPVNVDATCDDYVYVFLDKLIPMWGEGDTRTEAIHDLVESLGELLTDLRSSRDRLAPHLQEELLFLERLEWEFENRAEPR